MLTENLKTFEKVSDEQRIDLIRNLRNELINHFLLEQNLHIYFKENYNYELNAIREEFIKKELRELLISSVDLVQYATLLLEMKHADGTASLTINNDDLFYEELEAIFRKYTM
jgi:hypothetical protein